VQQNKTYQTPPCETEVEAASHLNRLLRKDNIVPKAVEKMSDDGETTLDEASKLKRKRKMDEKLQHWSHIKKPAESEYEGVNLRQRTSDGVWQYTGSVKHENKLWGCGWHDSEQECIDAIRKKRLSMGLPERSDRGLKRQNQKKSRYHGVYWKKSLGKWIGQIQLRDTGKFIWVKGSLDEDAVAESVCRKVEEIGGRGNVVNEKYGHLKSFESSI